MYRISKLELVTIYNFLTTKIQFELVLTSTGNTNRKHWTWKQTAMARPDENGKP